MRRLTLIFALTLPLGCSEAQIAEPESTYGGWTALQDLSMDTLMIVGPDASMGNWGAVQNGAASDAFQQGVDQFANAELPANLESSQAARDDLVRGCRDLIAAAKTGGNAQELEAAWQTIKDAQDRLNAALSAS